MHKKAEQSAIQTAQNMVLKWKRIQMKIKKKNPGYEIPSMPEEIKEAVC